MATSASFANSSAPAKISGFEVADDRYLGSVSMVMYMVLLETKRNYVHGVNKEEYRAGQGRFPNLCQYTSSINELE